MSDNPPPDTRRQTPRVPSNTLYNRLVPVAIGVMVVVLLIVVAVVVLGIGRGY